MIYTTQRRRFVYDTWDNGSRLDRVMVECTLSITHCIRLNLQLHTIDLVRTCRISSFCTVAWQLARFELRRRIARSLGDSWASCGPPCSWQPSTTRWDASWVNNCSVRMAKQYTANASDSSFPGHCARWDHSARPVDAQQQHGGYMFCCCFLFMFNDSCQTDYLKIYQTDLHYICTVCRTTAADDKSEISFLIP